MKTFTRKFIHWLLIALYGLAVVGFPATNNATVFAAEECSEAYLRNRQIAMVNCSGDSPCETGVTQVGGTDNIARIFNYFLSKGLTDFQIAGMLGNMKHESGIQPQVVQGRPGVVTPVESLTPAQLSDPQLGYGLVQWTPVRKMIDPVRAAGKNPNDLIAQLDFLWDQLEGRAAANEKAAGDHLKATTDVASATLSFETRYERHRGAPQPERIAAAEEILNNARASGITNASSSTGSAGTGTSSSSGLSKVYILGDSITHGASSRYNQAFGSRGIMPTISAVTSRSWNGAGTPSAGATGTQGSGLEALNTDRTAVQEAGAIVVALGTNGGIGSNPVEDALTAIRAINPSAPIYWVNISGTTPAVSPNMAPFNTKLSEQQSAGQLTVIDWAQVVQADASLLRDGVHPNDTGYQRLVDLVVNRVASGSGSTGSSDCVNGQPSTSGGTGLSGKVLAYAWPDYHPSPFTEKMPEYDTAIRNARSEGRYVGNDGVDCGGFITTIMVDSGFDPSYNHNGRGGPTPTQRAWLEANWQSLGEVTSTSQLQPGDVAMRPGHTFMFVGNIPGFNSQIASASNGERAPMAGREHINGDGVVWFRKR